ncbi:MAG: PIN/TRAM domain-containing protein [Planctomycetes bacterium]|nr:PIN/TRAM domain-containing protein [Planctomycetota bacterium]
MHLLRLLFVAVVSYIGYKFFPLISGDKDMASLGLFFGFAASVVLVLFEILFSRQFIAVFSATAVTILIGFLISKLALSAVYLIPTVASLRVTNPAAANLLDSAVILCVTFLSIILILRTKDEFRFVIPYVELRKQATFGRPIVLDTSAIIDGRIASLFETKILDCEIVIPTFVLEELQKLADSHDKLKRAKGRRGLDILNALRERKNSSIRVPEIYLPDIEGVDNKLIELGKTTNARIMTSDYQLEKVAQIQGIDVINLNALTKAVQLPIMQGDKLTIEILRRGEVSGQGVGFLPDGTMVVGEGCENKIGKTIDVVVKNIIQTTAGRIVFTEHLYETRKFGRDDHLS